MGIINITPDSFYIKGRYKNDLVLLKTIEKMLLNNVTFIDIGGYSTRPKADFVSEYQERKRVIPALKSIIKEFPSTLISLDTFRSKIAEEGIENGASIINDVSGGNMDSKIFEILGKYKVPYILNHMKGKQKNMHLNNKYENLIIDVIYDLQKKINVLKKFHINDIIVDPGIGFSKNLYQNYNILKNIRCLKRLDCPILIGVSRKSLIYKLLNTSSINALNGTTVLNTYSVLNKISIIRVHDTKEASEVIKIIKNLLK